jgi:2-polyprenyl-3-methyl-5-hydroxy-6-metoxy-1,4-benzoquinol methylase
VIGDRSACPACGQPGTHYAVAHDVEYRTTAVAYEYRRCEGCRSVYLPDPPIDQLATIYPPGYYAYGGASGGLVERVKGWMDRRTLGPLLQSLPGDELAALDVGGGDGWMLTRLRRLDRRVRRTTVVDLDQTAEVRATAAGHTYLCGRVEDVELAGPYDVILLLNLIEHVADPLAVLERLAGTLRPRGVILVKTPNVDSLDARLFRHREWGGFHCPRHWVLFDPDGFTDLANRAGLSVRRTTLTQGAPFWAVGTLAMLERRRLVRVSTERPMVRHPLFPVLLGLFGAVDTVRGLLGGRTSQMFVELTLAEGST